MLTPFIFTRIIDPLTRGLRRITLDQCGTGNSIIDLGCGPGTLAFELAEHNKVIGLDLSSEVIAFALRKAEALNLSRKASFLCENVRNIARFKENEFDVVVMSLFLHQFSETEQLEILSDASKIGRKLIIADYSLPLPGGFTGFGVRTAEFFAGGEHNRNFKAYTGNGGCPELAKKAGLSLLYIQKTSSGAFAVWVFE